MDRKRHIVCYPWSVPGLHAMAKYLGIKRKHFKGDHYMVPRGMEGELMKLIDGVITTRVLARIISLGKEKEKASEQKVN